MMILWFSSCCIGRSLGIASVLLGLHQDLNSSIGFTQDLGCFFVCPKCLCPVFYRWDAILPYQERMLQIPRSPRFMLVYSVTQSLLETPLLSHCSTPCTRRPANSKQQIVATVYLHIYIYMCVCVFSCCMYTGPFSCKHIFCRGTYHLPPMCKNNVMPTT